MSIEVDNKTDVSTLALEATLTAMKGAGWTNESLKAIKDAVDAMVPGPTAAAIWGFITRRLTNLDDVRAARIDNLDALISSRSNHSPNDVRDAILDDATRFSGADIDAPISSRSTLTQAQILSDATPFPGANVDAAVSSRASAVALATAQADLDNPDQYKADVSALALEATLTAIKGAGWTTETLKAIKDAVDAVTGGATAAEVWGYATRKLTDYHVSSDAWSNSLANASSLYPTAGYRFMIATYETTGMDIQWYTGAAWTGTNFARDAFIYAYQKYSSTTAGALRFRNSSGGATYPVYTWENVGASPVQPFKPAPGELVLEETPDYVIAVPERYLTEHKAEIEADVEDRLGYDRHRDVLTAMGFKMPKKEVTESA